MAGIDESREFIPVRIAVLTVSDTRTLETDASGDRLAMMLQNEGHELADRAIAPDDREAICEQVGAWIASPDVDCVIATGGTGLTGRDVTPEAFQSLYEKEIEGFAFLFHKVSFETIGLSTMQSRATGGVAKGTFLFSLPGSPGAVKDGWEKILKFQLDHRFRPCNLVEIMPRLTEK